MISNMYKWDYPLFLWWLSRGPDCPMTGCKAIIAGPQYSVDDLKCVEAFCPRCKTKFQCRIPASKRGIVISLNSGIE